jgi:ferric-dicitrate binding protein FerR (iron transport regulator)
VIHIASGRGQALCDGAELLLMSEDDRPRVVDLQRYRRAREQRASKPPPKPAPAPRRPSKRAKHHYKPPTREPVLGDRQGAGLILLLAAAVLLLLWFGPMLFNRA